MQNTSKKQEVGTEFIKAEPYLELSRGSMMGSFFAKINW